MVVFCKKYTWNKCEAMCGLFFFLGYLLIHINDVSGIRDNELKKEKPAENGRKIFFLGDRKKLKQKKKDVIVFIDKSEGKNIVEKGKINVNDTMYSISDDVISNKILPNVASMSFERSERSNAHEYSSDTNNNLVNTSVNPLAVSLDNSHLWATTLENQQEINNADEINTNLKNQINEFYMGRFVQPEHIQLGALNFTHCHDNNKINHADETNSFKNRRRGIRGILNKLKKKNQDYDP